MFKLLNVLNLADFFGTLWINNVHVFNSLKTSCSRLLESSVTFVWQLFLTNNHPYFHFLWKEYLLNHQIVSKYYERDCRFLPDYLTFSIYSQGWKDEQKVIVCIIWVRTYNNVPLVWIGYHSFHFELKKNKQGFQAGESWWQNSNKFRSKKTKRKRKRDMNRERWF